MKHRNPPMAVDGQKIEALAHTPGPWVACFGQVDPVHQGELIRQGDGTGDLVAVACDFNRFDRDNEHQANARLISAAPDLVEALRLILEEPGYELLDTHKSCAVEAIAKVEGET